MRALTLDFRRRHHPHRLGAAVLLLGLGAVAALGLHARQLAAQTALVEAGLRRVDPALRRKVHTPVSGADVQRVALELRQARAVAQQLGMPWDELFRTVEAVDAPTVALLGIESTADRRRIQISAEAKDFDAMVRYIRALEARALFADVLLNSHQIQQQDPQRPVRFTLSATWLTRPGDEQP